MTYQEMCAFDVLYAAYLEARKGKRKKVSTAQYEANALACTEKLSRILAAKIYIPGKFETFYVFEPKKRLVQAPAFVDKVVLHAVTDNILYEAVTKGFIRDNYASQKGKGTHDGLMRLKQFMVDYYRQYGAREEAIRAYFSEQEPDFRFRSDYRLSGWDEDTMLAYLQTPDALVEREAGQYIKDHQEQSLLTFLENDALRHKYVALLQDEDSPIHRMKAITDAVRDSGAKMVTVTVVKPEGELTFKAAADSLTGYRNYYSSYDIPAQDRREFERMFGKYADYHAEDITRITYGRNTIYEATPDQTEGLEQDDGPSMTMGGM